jgi:hypothetical protein
MIAKIGGGCRISYSTAREPISATLWPYRYILCHVLIRLNYFLMFTLQLLRSSNMVTLGVMIAVLDLVLLCCHDVDVGAHPNAMASSCSSAGE